MGREAIELITLKILKPYHILVDEKYVRLKLEHQFFSILVNGAEYEFIPTEAKEIIVNRKNKKIDNINAKFTFKREEEIIHLSMAKLIYHPEFLNQVYDIVKPYYYNDTQETSIDKKELDLIMDELEEANKKRLIDQALDNRNKELFYQLVKET